MSRKNNNVFPTSTIKCSNLERDLNGRPDVRSGRSHKCCGTLQPIIFDGVQDWETYRMQFKAVSTFNEWDDEAKGCALVASLRGEALTVLYTLAEDELFDYEKVAHALDRRFGKAHLANQLRYDLQHKRVKREEGVSLQKFEAELTRVVRLAYPDRSLSELEPIRLFSFVNGIAWNGVFEDWLQLMLSVYNGKVRNTEEMLEYALQCEQIRVEFEGATNISGHHQD